MANLRGDALRISRLSRREVLRVGAAIGGVALLSACTSSNDASTKSAESGKLGGQAAISGLDSIVSAAPYVIAAHEFYAQHQLSISNVHLAGGTETIRAIRGGSGFGSAATISTVLAYQGGAKDLRIIGGGFNAASVVFVGRPDTTITSPKDLKGKKIGIAGTGSPVEFFANLAVTKGGFKPGVDVQVVSVGDYASVWPSVEQGIVDLGALVPPTSSKLVTTGAGKVAITAAELHPGWADVCVCVTEKALKTNSDGLLRWMEAVRSALTLITDDVQRAASIWGPALKLDATVAQEALGSVPKEAWKVEINEEGVRSAAEAAMSLGLTKQADVSGLLDTSLLERL
ncbi:NMT1/THI5 like protein [Nonomuraea coxensis DSM 45129]|uniref:NMT1/THI5 like protein n=1 Tax=Nonomuraea coxensis DSM 45129 TaxID=1122611 RepID=A0ABX8UHS9_9ACTN|nr:NMT1/THI5 like protein [Nonomuraea coxensis DSM 45129]